ncbi:MAG: hypothetical protein WBC18_21755 [Ottowia sp.]|uniref:hypothetical protein n=1 Tax=Ottowia sp. TaxID=1898956 RepID=UPI003C72EC21
MALYLRLDYRARWSCDESLRVNFNLNLDTTVFTVKEFKKGAPLVLSKPVTQETPAAQNDVCVVKLSVGPSNQGPSGAPSTSASIGIEIWLPAKENWNGRTRNLGSESGVAEMKAWWMPDRGVAQPLRARKGP